MPETNAFYPFTVRGQRPRIFWGPVQENWCQAAEAQGFTVLGRGPGRQDLILGCHDCEEPLIRRTNVVLGSRIECRTCVRKPYDEAAAKFGAVMVGNDPEGDRHYRLWRLACGHVVRLQLGQVLKIGRGEVEADCITCREQRYSDEAAVHGWTLVRASDHRVGYYVYRHGCGVEREVSTGNMLLGDCACPECGPDKVSKPSFIYIFRIEAPGLSCIKFGFSARPRRRLRNQLGLPLDSGSSIHRLVPTRNGYVAQREEIGAHRYMRKHHLELIIPKSEFGDTLSVQSEIYRLEALPIIERLLDEIEARLSEDDPDD